jgi:hypothetical protein
MDNFIIGNRKYLIKAFAIGRWLFDKLSFIFITDTLFALFLLLVTVCIMFQAVFTYFCKDSTGYCNQNLVFFADFRFEVLKMTAAEQLVLTLTE